MGGLNECYKTSQKRLCKSTNRNVVGCKNLGMETPKDFRVRGAITTESEQTFEKFTDLGGLINKLKGLSYQLYKHYRWAASCLKFLMTTSDLTVLIHPYTFFLCVVFQHAKYFIFLLTLPNEKRCLKRKKEKKPNQTNHTSLYSRV